MRKVAAGHPPLTPRPAGLAARARSCCSRLCIARRPWLCSGRVEADKADGRHGKRRVVTRLLDICDGQCARCCD